MRTVDKGKKLNYWYVARFIAIFGVLIDHSQYFMEAAPWFIVIRIWLFSFFLQTFFVSPGAIDCWSNKKFSILSFPKFFIKRVIQLIIPYVLWCIILGPYISTPEFWIGVLRGTEQSLSGAGINSVLWFLPTMFVSSIMHYLLMIPLSRLPSKIKQPSVALVGILFGFLASLMCTTWTELPWGLGIAFMGTALMLLGYAMQWIWEKLIDLKTSIKLILLGVLLVASYGFSYLGCSYSYSETWYFSSEVIWMAHGFFGRHWSLFLLESIVSVTLVLLAGSFLEKSKVLVTMGMNTLVIMGVHVLIYQPVANCLIPILYNGFLLQLLSATCVAALCYPIVLIAQRFIPILAGRYRSSSNYDMPKYIVVI